MKKKSRFLTGLLSAVMALSLFAMPAAAAEGGGDPTANSVWSETSGSITIHKYEYNGSDGDIGTGEATDKAPTNATALPNAEFTVYQVKDKQWLEGYYSGAAGSYAEADLKWETYAKKDLTTGDYVLQGNDSSLKKVGTEVTDEYGKVTFNVDELGLYLVMETDAPDAVTSPCEPFLVSVPMTRVGTTNTNAEWLYDVHVYPKNKTSYGGVEITKKAQIGNSKAAGTLNGVVFKLYKYVPNGEPTAATRYTTTSTEDTWKEVTANSKNENLALTTQNGKISVNSLPKGYYCFVEQSVDPLDKAFIVNQTPHYFEITNNSTACQFDFSGEGGKLKLIGTPEANLQFDVVDTRPDLEKQVADNGSNNYVEASDYSVGDSIPYKITVTVPKELLTAKVRKASDFVFAVKDTPQHTWVNRDVKIYAESSSTETSHSGIVVNYDDNANENNGKGFNVTFTQDALKELTSNGTKDKFTIKYTAVLQKDALNTAVGNPNKATLDYSNKIDEDGCIVPGDGNKSEIEDDAAVYTFMIKIEKHGDSENGTLLNGVKFDLYKEVVDEEATQGSDLGITGEDGEKYFKLVEHLTTVNGEVSYSGLAKGTYYLVETETVSPYNLLKGAVKVELDIAYEKTWNAKDVYEKGRLIHHDESEREKYFNKDSKKTTGDVTSVIVNRKGFTLPRTGGFGTLLFSGIGALLVVGGVGVLMSTKKKKGNA